jgi:hypothetical protein
MHNKKLVNLNFYCNKEKKFSCSHIAVPNAVVVVVVVVVVAIIAVVVSVSMSLLSS